MKLRVALFQSTKSLGDDSHLLKGHFMPPFQIFIIRAIVGAGFAVLVVRIFYGRVQIVYVAGLAIFMVGMAYVMEYFRKKREKKP